MRKPPVRLAVALVHGWTRVYTWRLPQAVGDVRRAEIESDVWESVHDPDRQDDAQLPIRILARLLLGIPDDLGWRFEQENAMTRAFTRRLALALGLIGMLGLWLVLGSPSQPLPLPDAPRLAAGTSVAPPPPPPPPSLGAAATSDIPLLHADASYVATRGAVSLERLKDVRPVYPPVAVWKGIGGRVGVEATIDERGRVADARVVVPAHWVLNQSALNAVRQWEFAPAPLNGPPRPVTIVATIDFTPPR